MSDGAPADLTPAEPSDDDGEFERAVLVVRVCAVALIILGIASAAYWYLVSRTLVDGVLTVAALVVGTFSLIWPEPAARRRVRRLAARRAARGGDG